MKKRLQLIAGITIVLGVILAGYLFFFQNDGYWVGGGESFSELLHDKGHWYLELFIGFIEIVIVDVLLLFVGWKLLLKPYIAERHAQAIAEEHDLHGIEEHDHELHEKVAHLKGKDEREEK